MKLENGVFARYMTVLGGRGYRSTFSARASENEVVLAFAPVGTRIEVVRHWNGTQWPETWEKGGDEAWSLVEGGELWEE